MKNPCRSFPKTILKPKSNLLKLLLRGRRARNRHNVGKRKNDRRPINYFGALDDIIADIYEKQAGAYKIVNAIQQLFESRGQDVPFQEAQFNRICGNLAMAQATREIALLYGLGLEHAEHVTSLMIEKSFGWKK